MFSLAELKDTERCLRTAFPALQVRVAARLYPQVYAISSDLLSCKIQADRVKTARLGRIDEGSPAGARFLRFRSEISPVAAP